MANLELLELSVEGTTPALQLYDLTLVADPPPDTGLVLRLFELQLRGTGGGPILTPVPVLPSALVAAGTTVTMAVAVDAYDSIEWVQQIGSLDVELAGTDTEKMFTAPYDPRGGSVLFSISAHDADGDSDPLFVTVGVLPHTDWHLADGAWVPTLASDTLGD